MVGERIETVTGLVTNRGMSRISWDMPELPTTSIPALVRRAAASFERRFERPPTLLAAAPGRVNLIGEHTDYNDGYVLPMAIERWVVAVADRITDDDSDGWSTLRSIDLEEEIRVDLGSELVATDTDWANYLLGVASGFASQGHALPNLDFAMTSSIPIGAGLSSSAAIDVAAASVFEQSLNLQLDDVEKARLCQDAEATFAGVRCGLMDPMVSVAGKEGHALLIDCRDHVVTPVPLPGANEAVILVANTHRRHALNTDAYGRRRRECEKAVIALQDAGLEDVRSLRDVSADALKARASSLDPVCLKRARHVVHENARVLRTVDALRAGDLQTVGRLMFESHESLTVDYEVSCPELDVLVDLAGELSETRTNRDRGVYGARLTGAGFGGCTVTLVRPEAVESIRTHMVEGYRARFDTEPTIFVTHATDGAHAIR